MVLTSMASGDMSGRPDARLETDAERGRAILAQRGVLSANGDRARFTRLKGLTNRVYLVETPAGRFCLRIPGSGTAAIIDRRAEEHCARMAAAAGVAPAVVYFDDVGAMVTPFVAGKSLSAQAFRCDPTAISRAAAALRHLHDRSGPFATEFRAFSVVEHYRYLLGRRGSDILPSLAQTMDEASYLRMALAARPAALKPCHCDPTGANLLDTGEKVWLIDWEYAGMNDPFWDLAYLSLQSDFTAAMDGRLLSDYLGRPALPAEAARLTAQKAACELLSAAWALVQDSAGNRAADFRSYAAGTLQRLQARLRSDAFVRALRTLRSG
jgi:thiamine kinase-like enzyme